MKLNGCKEYWEDCRRSDEAAALRGMEYSNLEFKSRDERLSSGFFYQGLIHVVYIKVSRGQYIYSDLLNRTECRELIEAGHTSVQ